MRRTLASLAAVAVTGSLVAATAAFAATKSVTVGDNYFVRSKGVPKVTVKRGTTVKWVWRGKKSHNVRVSKGPVRFQSKFMVKGSYRKKMTRRGTYTLVCDVHGARDQSMKLVVK